MTHKIVTVLGARPQFVKAAAVSRALRAKGDFKEIIVHTGQHYDPKMSDVFFEELDLPRPDHLLEIGSGLHGAQTGRMLEAVEKVLVSERPDWVLVYGDTNSTIAGALAAAKLHIRVAHVEAGLRSFNRKMPEEINRVVTDHLSDLLFAPTDASLAQLIAEGIDRSKIQVVGDVMFDSVLHFTEKAERTSGVLSALGLLPGYYALATVHRPSNTDDPAQLARVLGGLADASSSVQVVLPLHPRTAAQASRQGLRLDASPRLKVIEPLGYLDMLMLEKNAAAIVTDSGGVQKEAFFFGVPCVTLREETEWRETIELGWNRLVSPGSREAISQAIAGALGTKGLQAKPYGDGRASRWIADCLGRAAG